MRRDVDIWLLHHFSYHLLTWSFFKTLKRMGLLHHSLSVSEKRRVLVEEISTMLRFASYNNKKERAKIRIPSVQELFSNLLSDDLDLNSCKMNVYAYQWLNQSFLSITDFYLHLSSILFFSFSAVSFTNTYESKNNDERGRYEEYIAPFSRLRGIIHMNWINSKDS